MWYWFLVSKYVILLQNARDRVPWRHTSEMVFLRISTCYFRISVRYFVFPPVTFGFPPVTFGFPYVTLYFRPLLSDFHPLLSDWISRAGTRTAYYMISRIGTRTAYYMISRAGTRYASTRAQILMWLPWTWGLLGLQGSQKALQFSTINSHFWA